MATRVTCSCAPNLAIVKYWGKRDVDLNIPLNDSISLTLSQEELETCTTVAISPTFEKDAMWVNQKSVNVQGKRVAACLEATREYASSTLSSVSSLRPWEWKVRIASVNNFPTGAGLASSAAGYACLAWTYVLCLYRACGCDPSSRNFEWISRIARVGSGSACRSVFGGFVHWHSGLRADGKDSVACPIAPVSHWPLLRVLITLVNKGEKEVGSTVGMATSVSTSSLLEHRVQNVVPQRIKAVAQAIQDRDFASFGKLAMQDSNQLHSICLDTFPPISYLEPISFHIVRLVHWFNSFVGRLCVAYTFDAGPNAVLFLEEKDVPLFVDMLLVSFPSVPLQGASWLSKAAKEGKDRSKPWKEQLEKEVGVPKASLCGLIGTGIGDGPREMKGVDMLESVDGQ